MALTASTAVLLALFWPPATFNTPVLIAFVPLLAVVFSRKRAWSVYAHAYGMYTLFLVLLNWGLFMDGRQLSALVAGALIVPLLWSVPFLIAFKVKQRFGMVWALILLPFLYVSQEILHYYWDLAFAWTHLGLSIANDRWLMGLYPLFGQEGGTVFILAINAAVYFLWWKFQRTKLSIRDGIPLTALLSLMIVPGLFWLSASDEKEFTVAFFQPPTLVHSQVKNDLDGQIDMLEKQLTEDKFEGADLLICPESFFFDMEVRPLIVNHLHRHPAIIRLSELSQRYNTPILAGAILVELYKSEEPPTPSAKVQAPGVFYDVYNGSLFFQPDGGVDWRSKQHLVPFSEKVPFYSLLNSLEEWGLWPTRIEKTYGVSEFKGPYQYGDLSVVPAVCYESLFPPVLAGYLENGAGMVAVLSNQWTEADLSIQRQRDYVNVNAVSFGKPVLFSCMDAKSSVVTADEANDFNRSRLMKSTVVKQQDSYLYGYVARNLWLWPFVAIVLGLRLLATKRKRVGME